MFSVEGGDVILEGVFVAMQQFEQHKEAGAREKLHFRVRSPIKRL
jgi:hypothetical protein